MPNTISSIRDLIVTYWGMWVLFVAAHSETLASSYPVLLVYWPDLWNSLWDTWEVRKAFMSMLNLLALPKPCSLPAHRVTVAKQFWKILTAIPNKVALYTTQLCSFHTVNTLLVTFAPSMGNVCSWELQTSLSIWKPYFILYNDNSSNYYSKDTTNLETHQWRTRSLQ